MAAEKKFVCVVFFDVREPAPGRVLVELLRPLVVLCETFAWR